MKWSAMHRLGARPASSRACEVIESERCARGLTSRCVSHMAKTGYTIEMRTHFCDGIGYVGEDDTVTRGDGTVIVRYRIDGIVDL